MTIAFRALGPVAVEFDGLPLTLGPTQLALVAVLLARTRHWASTEELIDVIWPNQEPAKAVNSLRVHAHRVRAQFRDAGRHRLITEAAGYRLVVEHDELDLDAFADAERKARDHGIADPRAACRVLREALDLWRGEPFANIDIDVLRESAERYRVAREGIVTALAEYELANGMHRAVRAEVDAWAGEFSWSEDLARSQVLVHYRSGDVQAAVDRHRAFTRRLRDELGIDPSASFRDLLTKLLNGDPSLAGPAARSSSLRPPAAPPGRAGECRQVLAGTGQDASGSLAIVAPGGFGKTTLVEYLAQSRPGWMVCRQGPTANWWEPLGRTTSAVVTGEPNPPDPHLRLARDVAESLREHATEVLVIDDADHLGGDALEVLRTVAAMPGVARLVLTGRTLERLLALDLPIADVVELRALDEAAARSVALDLLATQDHDLVDSVVSSAGGHPLLLTALCRHLAGGGRPEDVPGSVTVFVTTLFRDLSDGQRALAHLAALDQFSELDLHLLGEALGCTTESVLDRVDALVAAGLFSDSARGVSFRHKAFREATVAMLSAARQRSGHARLAEVLLGSIPSGASLVQVQRLTNHLEGAVSPTRGPELANWSAAEAELLLQHGRVLDAAAAFDRAATAGERARLGEATTLAWRLAGGHARACAGAEVPYQLLAWELAPRARVLGPEMFAKTAVAAAGLWTPGGAEGERARVLLEEAWDGRPALPLATRVAVIEAGIRAGSAWTEAGEVERELNQRRADGDSDVKATAVRALHHLAWARGAPAEETSNLSGDLVMLTRDTGGEAHLEAWRLHAFDLFAIAKPEKVVSTLDAYHVNADRMGSALHQWWACGIYAALADMAGAANFSRELARRSQEYSIAVERDLVIAAELEKMVATAVRTAGPDRGGEISGEEISGAATWDAPPELDSMVLLGTCAMQALSGLPTDVSAVDRLWSRARENRRSRGASVLATIALRGCARDDRRPLAEKLVAALEPEAASWATVSGMGNFGIMADYLADLEGILGRPSKVSEFTAIAHDVRSAYHNALSPREEKVTQ